MSDLTHLDEQGQARMVDVGGKAPRPNARPSRRAASGCSPETLRLLRGRMATCPKGMCSALARVAGIMAAKRTAELIPLCHPLLLTKVAVDFAFDEADVSGRDHGHRALHAAKRGSRWRR